MTESDYQINELAKKAGVSVRTIRFYIDEGLLPAPSTRGRYTVYSDDYLERIQLIRLLKNRFLPLKQIRSRLAGLGADQVRAALREEKAQASPATPTDSSNPGGSGALAYIDRLLKPAAGSGEVVSASRNSLRYSLKEPQTSPGTTPEDEEAWARIRLAPGIELHIQQPVEESDRTRLRLLVAYARKIFNL